MSMLWGNAMGGTKSPGCNQIAYDIWDWYVNNNSWLPATHIAGVENTEADKESRLFNDRTEWTLKREIFARITTHWGTPEIDLFATRRNTKLPKFVSWKPDPVSCFVDAFTISWSMHFRHSVKFTDACKRFWRNKHLRESWSYPFGPPKFGGHNC